MYLTTQGYRAGMPQLSLTGISENWILKECGQKHWDALASHGQRERPDFFDDVGRRSYAAFTAIRVRTAGFEKVRENDDFEIRTSLHRVGQARHFSRHELISRREGHCSVSMSSTFVTRSEVANNRSISRATLTSLAGEIADPPAEAAEMFALGKAVRNSDLGNREAISRELLPNLNTQYVSSCEFHPCPNGDFNGADLLYFASFQAFVDRAEWQTHKFKEPPVTTARDMFFYGNVNLGDSVLVRTIGERIDKRGIAHWCHVLRASDGAKIADVITEKRWKNS
ncbi:Pnap_2097 family protein [Paraburkholderia xenovorans]|uniref:Pnap_2097 family protein n=1 Tax=Paraburkholderia xenovorans TaxID=36873 RepID=UPI0038BD3425